MLEIFSITAIIFLSSSGIFQIVKLFKTKTAHDISLIMCIFWTFGCLIFFIRALIIKDNIFSINYGLSSLICLIIIAQIIYYRFKK